MNEDALIGNINVKILIEDAFIGNINIKMENFSMHEFTIIKAFNVDIHPPKAPKIIEVLWLFLAIGWLRCNTDEYFFYDWAFHGGLF